MRRKTIPLWIALGLAYWGLSGPEWIAARGIPAWVGLILLFLGHRWLLRRFAGMTSPGARIIAETNDPYQTSNPLHLRYHRRNRAAGRMGGQIRIRVRYRNLATPYFDYLMVSKDEMRRIACGAGWRVARFIDSPGSIYIAVLEKETQR